MAQVTQDLVRVENLAIDFSTAYGDVAALRDVSFSICKGEVLGIVGESGSGKTVACRAILKLIAANARVKSGRILFEGQDVLTMNEAALTDLRGVPLYKDAIHLRAHYVRSAEFDWMDFGHKSVTLSDGTAINTFQSVAQAKVGVNYKW